MRAIEFTNHSNTAELAEVSMSPGALEDFAKTPLAQNMSLGFEAEMVVPDLEKHNDTDWAPDYSKDFSFPTKNYYEKVFEFLTSGDMPDNRRWIEVRLGKLDEEYLDYLEEEFYNYIHGGKGGELLRKEIGKALGTNDEDEIADAIDAQDTTYEAALDAVRSIYYNTVDLFDEFLRYKGIETVKDFAEKYNITWPYITFNTGGSLTYEDLEQDFVQHTGFKSTVGREYHSVKRQPGLWIFEPDSSIESGEGSGGVELISPPMKLPQAFEAFDKFWDWAESSNITANQSCGFHVGVSLPSQSTENIDKIKLILFLGDNHVLQAFGRAANSYAQSTLDWMINTAKARQSIRNRDLEKDIKTLKAGINSLAHNAIKRIIDPGYDRYLSINMKEKYIEFRSAGGNYFENKNKIINTMLRYVRAIAIASDPEAEKAEYAKKLYKLLASAVKTDSDTVKYFAQYATGQLSIDALKNVIKSTRQKRTAKKPD